MSPRPKSDVPSGRLPMLSSVNVRSSAAVYIQIENNVRFAIASGQLEPKDQLPSVRELSQRLDVNPNTVAKAYRDLEVMGLLYTRRGMGVFIKEGAYEKCVEDTRRDIITRLHEVVGEAKAAGLSATEVKQIVEKCLKTKSPSPYSEVPASLLSLAKKAKK